jgi:hypothetical protein
MKLDQVETMSIEGMTRREEFPKTVTMTTDKPGLFGRQKAFRSCTKKNEAISPSVLNNRLSG